MTIRGMVSIFLSMLFVSTTLFGACPYQEITSIKALNNVFASLTPDDLVVLDIDYTIIVPETFVRLICPQGERFKVQDFPFIKKFYDCLRYHMQSIPKPVLEFMKSNAKHVLIEEDSKSVIANNLQARGVKVLALTAAPSGEKVITGYDSNPIHINLEEERYEILKDLGIDFDVSFKEHGRFHLPAVLGESNEPYFYKGILFGENKSIALNSFLDHIGWRPRTIVFIDDNMNNIQDVASHCDAADKVCCYLYSVAHKQTLDLDYKVLEFQLDLLVHYYVFLNKCEVAAFLQNNGFLWKTYCLFTYTNLLLMQAGLVNSGYRLEGF